MPQANGISFLKSWPDGDVLFLPFLVLVVLEKLCFFKSLFGYLSFCRLCKEANYVRTH